MSDLNPDRSRVVKQWTDKAENDLKNASHTLSMGDDCPYDTVCFHAQQGGLLGHPPQDCTKEFIYSITCRLPGYQG